MIFSMSNKFIMKIIRVNCLSQSRMFANFFVWSPENAHNSPVLWRRVLGFEALTRLLETSITNITPQISLCNKKNVAYVE